MSAPVDRANGAERDTEADPVVLKDQQPTVPQRPPAPVWPAPVWPVAPEQPAPRQVERPVQRPPSRRSRYRAPENVARSTALGDPPRLWTERPADAVSLLKDRPRARANVALVLVTARGDCREFGVERQPSIGQLVCGGFRTLYEVDCGMHRFYATAKLPSAEDGFPFRAELHLTWRVAEAAIVVRRQIHDIGRELLPDALHRIRPLSRQHDRNDAVAAETSINDHFREQCGLARAVRAELVPRVDTGDGPFGLSFGVDVTTFVWLGLDGQRQDQIRVDDRIKHYRDIIDSGDVDQFALRLARHPEDVTEVVAMIRRWRTEERAAAVEFVAQLVDSGALDRWEIDDQVREALRWLRASTSRVLGLPDDRPERRVPKRRLDDPTRRGFAPFRPASDRAPGGENGSSGR